jgi:hypothetical protein
MNKFKKLIRVLFKNSESVQPIQKTYLISFGELQSRLGLIDEIKRVSLSGANLEIVTRGDY